MPHKIITGPLKDPVTLGSVKESIQVDHTYDDAVLGRIIKRARHYIESRTGLSLIDTTWCQYLDEFPGHVIRLSKAPVSQINSIKYYDINGTLQTVDSDNYSVDLEQHFARIAPVSTYDWPDTQDCRLNAVEIEFVAGFGSNPSDVPEDLQGAIILLSGYWYENRDTAGVQQQHELPFCVESLLEPHTLLSIA